MNGPAKLIIFIGMFLACCCEEKSPECCLTGTTYFHIQGTLSCKTYSWCIDGTVIASDHNFDPAVVQSHNSRNINFYTHPKNVTYICYELMMTINCSYSCLAQSNAIDEVLSMNKSLPTTTVQPNQPNNHAVVIGSVLSIAFVIAIVIGLIVFCLCNKDRISRTFNKKHSVSSYSLANTEEPSQATSKVNCNPGVKGGEDKPVIGCFYGFTPTSIHQGGREKRWTVTDLSNVSEIKTFLEGFI
ncbi:uncharacterized protein LOC134310320 [Trichomycterus rosablanca]|uniref:uncharacterized protein LOC134310320 n=1 Tax=Trichomycterus rosablanca TaxID=2290929 RepID=UPI002F35CBD5